MLTYASFFFQNIHKTFKYWNILEISREKGDVQESECFSQMTSPNCALSLLKNNCKNFRRIYTF